MSRPPSASHRAALKGCYGGCTSEVKLESGRLCAKYKEDLLPCTVFITASCLPRLHWSLGSILIEYTSQFLFQSEWLISVSAFRVRGGAER